MDGDYCLLSNETSSHLETISESIRTILGPANVFGITIEGDVCYCDSDECNSASSMTFNLLATVSSVVVALLGMLLCGAL